MPACSIADYADVMLAIPGTASEIAQRAGWAASPMRIALRRLQHLGLVRPAMLRCVGQTREVVWAAGAHGDEHPTIAGAPRPMRPKAAMIAFAHLWRAFADGATIDGAAEECGVCKLTAWRLMWRLRERQHAHVGGWETDSQGRAVAAWRIGHGRNAPKPRSTSAEKSKRYRDTRRLRRIETLGRIVA